MSKNNSNKLQDLFQLSINNYKIHKKMIEEGRDPVKFKIYLDHLRMSMELEEKIYQSLDIEEMKTYLTKYRRTPVINTIKGTRKIDELEKPFYRTICSLRDMCSWKEDPEIEEDYLLDLEMERLQTAIKNAVHSSIVLELKFILIYLNLLRRSKKSKNVKEHFDVLYMNRLLEMKLLDYQLRPLHFDQIDDFLALNWDVKIEPEQEETFGNTCINTLLNYMEGIMNSNGSIQIDRSEYIYQLTNYYMATPDQKVSYLAQGDKLFNDPRLTKEKEKIMNQFYYDIDAINQGNDRVRKI